MPKYRRERISSPCHKLSGLKLRRLASRTFNTLASCRYGRPATAPQPAPFLLYPLRSTLIIYKHPPRVLKSESFSNQHSGRHISCKVSRPESIVKFCLRSRTVNNLPFPWKRVFFTHNLPVCLFLTAFESRKYPSTG